MISAPATALFFSVLTLALFSLMAQVQVFTSKILECCQEVGIWFVTFASLLSNHSSLFLCFSLCRLNLMSVCLVVWPSLYVQICLCLPVCLFVYLPLYPSLALSPTVFIRFSENCVPSLQVFDVVLEVMNKVASDHKSSLKSRLSGLEHVLKGTILGSALPLLTSVMSSEKFCQLSVAKNFLPLVTNLTAISTKVCQLIFGIRC